jgi:hypothetical protein
MGAVMIDFGADGVLAGKVPKIEPVVSGGGHALAGEGRETKAMLRNRVRTRGNGFCSA